MGYDMNVPLEQTIALEKVNPVTDSALPNSFGPGLTMPELVYKLLRVVNSAVANDLAMSNNFTNLLSAFEALRDYVAENGFGDGSVTTDKIADGAVTTDKLAPLSVGFNQLASGSVKGDRIATHSIESYHINNRVIGATHIMDGNVVNEKIADGAVTKDKISAGAVDSVHLAEKAVRGAHLELGSVNSKHIADGAVVTETIANGAITDAKIANGAITGAKIAEGTTLPDGICGTTYDIHNFQDNNGSLLATLGSVRNFIASGEVDARFRSVQAKELSFGNNCLIAMGFNQVHGVSEPTENYDAANKRYVDAHTEPLILYAPYANEYPSMYLEDSRYGNAALSAIKSGKPIFVRVPPAAFITGNFSPDECASQNTALFSPVYHYQLPNNSDNKYLYLFYLRDEKTEVDLSTLGLGRIQLPVYGQIKLNVDNSSSKCTLDYLSGPEYYQVLHQNNN